LPSITHPALFDAVASTAKLAAPLEIDGSLINTGPAPQNIASTPGLLDIEAPGVTVRGFTLRGFSGFGIVLGTHSGGDTIAGDAIGTNPAGTAVTQANTAGGVLVLSAGSTVGGTTAADLNIISGNAFGVYLFGSGATNNHIIGNHIGTDRAGGTILGSSADKVDGIEVDGASGNFIGGPTPAAGSAPGNLIEGYQAGIYLFDGAANNVIQGNAIRGNGIANSSNSGQELGGILLTNASNNQIGGTGAGNDLSNNTGSGVVIFGSGSGNTLAGNHIANNTSTGVYIFNAGGNHVGINGAGNTITGNSASGVDLEGASASGNTVVANMIQGNSQDGVYVFNAPNNVIGGTTAGDGNTIMASGFNGVHLEGSGATGNTVQGNTIANQSAGYGVLLENGATGNTVGGAGSAANMFQNNALGNVQVLNNGLPPSGDPTGGNAIGPNTTTAAAALAAAKLKKHIKVIHLQGHRHHTPPRFGQHHPRGPRRRR
jgi:parallel beta-helix repeat protein